jgi:hypothetical protein
VGGVSDSSRIPSITVRVPRHIESVDVSQDLS